MKHTVLAFALSLALSGAVSLAGDEAKAPPLTLTKAMERIEALRAPLTLDLEGANLNNALEWLENAGVAVILPASAKPREGDNTPAIIVKVKDLPVGLVVDQFLAAAEYKYDVKIAEVNGKAVCLVAISLDWQGGGLMRMIQNRMGGGPGGPPAFGGPGGAGFPRAGAGGLGRGPGGAAPGGQGPQRGRGGNRGGPGAGAGANNPNQQAAEPGDPF